MLFIHRWKIGIWSVQDFCTSVSRRLVDITMSCAIVAPWAAIVNGFISALVQMGLNLVTFKFKHVDPFQATQSNVGCGAWGLIFAGLFAN